MLYVLVYRQCIRETGVPLTFTPLFRLQRPAVARRSEMVEGDGVIESRIYPARSARVLAVEICDGFGCKEIVVGDPQILTSVVSSPFD